MRNLLTLLIHYLLDPSTPRPRRRRRTRPARRSSRESCRVPRKLPSKTNERAVKNLQNVEILHSLFVSELYSCEKLSLGAFSLWKRCGSLFAATGVTVSARLSVLGVSSEGQHVGDSRGVGCGSVATSVSADRSELGRIFPTPAELPSLSVESLF